MRKIVYVTVVLVLVSMFSVSVYAQEQGADNSSFPENGLKALAMAIAAAGCGYGQSRVLTGACEGVSRNPGSADTIRFFFILGLAFIEFLALLTFLYVGFF
jgi:F-type H+-transporting ATPase subunit c